MEDVFHIADSFDVFFRRAVLFKIKRKYDTHGANFVVFSTPNNQVLAEFENAILDHIANPSTIVIKGTYRGTQQVTHFYNPETGLNVIRDINGAFLSGWRLGDEQIENILRHGNLQ